MAARLEVSQRGYQLLLAMGAVGLGLLAGLDPRLAIAAAIGLGFVVLVLGDVTFGLCVFAVISFLDLLPALGGSLLSFSKIVGFLLAVSWLAKITSKRETRNDFLAAHPMFSFTLGAFLGLAAFSLLWAEDPTAGRTPLLRYALNLVLFLIVYTAVRTPKQFTWTVAAYVGGAAAAAAYAVLSPPPETVYNDVTRATGTFGDPNELAAVLVPGLILAGALAATLKRAPVLRILAVLAGALAAAGILLTLSRGGLIALGFALVISLFAAGRWRVQAFIVVLAIVVSGFLYFGYVASDQAVARVTEAEGGTGRSDLWHIGWRMVLDKPVTGVGIGNFQTASIHYLLAPGSIKRDEFIVDQPKAAHNTYLQVQTELGAVGFALFVLIVGSSLLAMLRAAKIFERRGERGLELLARSLFIAVAGVLAADFFISEQYSKQLWLLLALGPGLLGVARGLVAPGEADAEAAGDPGWRPDGR
jgi:putative inorganic carbon (HCO3(-)) transporter